jgi:hypothetical protein
MTASNALLGAAAVPSAGKTINVAIQMATCSFLYMRYPIVRVSVVHNSVSKKDAISTYGADRDEI